MKHFFPTVVGFLVLILIIGAGGLWYASQQSSDNIIEPTPPPTQEPPDRPMGDKRSEPGDTIIPSIFTLDEGFRADYASNPMIIGYEDGLLTLAYESHTTGLKFAPQEKVKLIQATDGITFTQIDNPTTESPKPPGVQINDALWRRYIFRPNEGGVYSTSSTDGITYEEDNLLIYEANAESASDAREFGVYTYFRDSNGGVTLLYNYTNTKNEVAVGKLYAQPESLGTEFEKIQEDVLRGTLESEHYADPYTTTLSDGRILLIVMNQEDGSRPPEVPAGTIHAYLSSDEGATFVYKGQLLSWRDIQSTPVHSLNDPKIIELDDGTIRLYVAAMIDDETVENPGELVDGKITGYKWMLISAHGSL